MWAVAHHVYGSKNTNTQVLGEIANYVTASDWAIAEGRFVSDADAKRRARVAVRGQTVPQPRGCGQLGAFEKP